MNELMFNYIPETTIISSPALEHFLSDKAMTMSSIEIAALTGKQHAHVMRNIIKMITALGEVDVSTFGGIYTDSYGREMPCFNLPRREVDLLLTGYNVKMRAAVYDRWRELEIENRVDTRSIKKNLVYALNAACVLEDEANRLSHQVDELQKQICADVEKVHFYDSMVKSSQLFSVAKVAKTLGTGQKRLFEYMRTHKILMSNRHSHNEPYQEHQDAGRFQVKWKKRKNHVTGKTMCIAIPLFTGTGLIWIEQFTAKHGRDGL